MREKGSEEVNGENADCLECERERALREED